MIEQLLDSNLRIARLWLSGLLQLILFLLQLHKILLKLVKLITNIGVVVCRALHVCHKNL